VAGNAWDGRDLVWCGPQGQPIDPHDNWEEWKTLLAEACTAKDARLLHDARHTAGTLLGEQHVDMHVIQRILGHAQVTTTRIYTEPTDPLTREAVGLIGKALWLEMSAAEPHKPGTSPEFRPPTGTTVSQQPEPRPQTVAREPEPRCRASTGLGHSRSAPKSL
jgi:hypothetical protein